MADKFVIENGYEAIISDAAKSIIGGGSSITLTATVITENTVVTAPEGTAFSTVTVEVPTPTVSDGQE